MQSCSDSGLHCSLRGGIVNYRQLLLMEWSGRAPACQHEMLATGAQVKEHAMSQKLNAAIMLRIIEDLAGDWRRLDARIEGLSSEIETLARQD